MKAIEILAILTLLLVIFQSSEAVIYDKGEPFDMMQKNATGKNADAFHMVVLGDSIAWGSGLNDEDKYCSLIKKWLEEEKLSRPVYMKNYAQTGAHLIGHSTNKSCDQNCGRPYPSVEDQIDKVENPDSVRLVLLSGGINDVGVFTIIDANVDASKITNSSEFIKTWMTYVLEKSLKKFPNAKIIVTDYYPIITRNTTDYAFFKVQYYFIYTFLLPKQERISYHLFGLPITILPSDYEDRLIKNSEVFNQTSTKNIRIAVETANTYSREVLKDSEERIAFAPVNFPSDRCYGTENSWLWKLKLVDFKNRSILTNDNLVFYRWETCLKCPDKKVYDVVNAIGHPNSDGAKLYARSIESAIESKGPKWL